MEATYDIIKAIADDRLEIKDLLSELNEQERALAINSLLSYLSDDRGYYTEVLKKVLSELNEEEFLEYAGKYARKLDFRIFKEIIPSEFNKEKIFLNLFNDLSLNGDKNRISDKLEVALEAYKQGFEVGKEFLKEDPYYTLSELSHKEIDIPEKMVLDTLEGEIEEIGNYDLNRMLRKVLGDNPSKEAINKLFELGIFNRYNYEEIKDKIDINECLVKYGNKEVFIMGLIERATSEDWHYLLDNFPDLESHLQVKITVKFPEMYEYIKDVFDDENRKIFLDYSELSEDEQKEIRSFYTDEYNEGLNPVFFKRFTEDRIENGSVRNFKMDYDINLESGKTLREEIKDYFLKNYIYADSIKSELSFISSMDLAFAEEIIKDIVELEDFEPVNMPLSGKELNRMGFSFLEEENKGHILNNFNVRYQDEEGIVGALSEEQLKEYVEEKGLRNNKYLLERYFAEVESADLSILSSLNRGLSLDPSSKEEGTAYIGSDCLKKRVETFGGYEEILNNLDSLSENLKKEFFKIPIKEEYGVIKIDFVRKFISTMGMEYMKDKFPRILADEYKLSSNDFMAEINRMLIKEVLANNTDKKDEIDLKFKNELRIRGFSLVGVANFIDYCSMERDFVIPSNIRKEIYEIYDTRKINSDKRSVEEGIKTLLLKESSAKTVENLSTYRTLKEMDYYNLEELSHYAKLQEVRDLASEVMLREIENRESERERLVGLERIKTENKDYYVKEIKEEVMSVSQIEQIADRLISSMEDLLDKDIDLKEVDTIELFNRVKEKINKVSSKYQLR